MSKFFDLGVRIESLILIEAALIDEDSYPDAFQEFCDGLPEGAGRPLYAQLPVLARYADADDEPEPEAVAETLILSTTRGFLVQAATPVKDFYGDGNGCTYSWGHYHTEWLYAKDVADIETVCAAWAEASDAKDRAKVLA